MSGEPPPPKNKKGYLQTGDNLEPLVKHSICVVGGSGYYNSEPPAPDGDDACPHCHLAPCIITRPSWLMGSTSAELANVTKRFKLHGRFWTLLGQLGM